MYRAICSKVGSEQGDMRAAYKIRTAFWGADGVTTHLLPPAGEYKRLRALIMGPGKGNKGLMQQMSKQMGRGGNMNSHNMQQNIAQMSRMLPPQACPCCPSLAPSCHG